jgi:hypothetical protein
LAKARQHLNGFLLRHGKVYAGQKTWTLAYRRWLTTVRFDHQAQQIVLQDYIHAVADAEKRVARLVQQIEQLLETWSIAGGESDSGDARHCHDQCGDAGGGNRQLHALRQSPPAHVLTGIIDPALLRASHIIPWSDCNDEPRRYGRVGAIEGDHAARAAVEQASLVGI